MLGFAGWIGSLFLLGFIGVAFQFVLRSGGAFLITGAAVCAGAVSIFRRSRKDFAVPFGLAPSFAGQALFIGGLIQIFEGNSSFLYMAVAGFEAVLSIVIVNSTHRVVSALAAAVSVSFALSAHGMRSVAPALLSLGLVTVWLNEFQWVRHGSFVRPLGYGFVLAAIYVPACACLRWRLPKVVTPCACCHACCNDQTPASHRRQIRDNLHLNGFCLLGGFLLELNGQEKSMLTIGVVI